MKNKRVKQMIEDVTPINYMHGLPFNIFPWSNNWGESDSEIDQQRSVIRKVRKLVSPEAFKEIEEILDESYTHDYAITFDHGGVKEVDYEHVKHIYIDQRCQFEDSYYGTVWIPITPKRFFKFSFSM